MLLPVAILAGALLSLPLAAADVTWQAVDGNWNGDWSQTAHWSTGSLPTSSDKVIFPKGNGDFTVTVNAEYTVGSVDVDAATGDAGQFTLSGSGRIALAGSNGDGYSSWIRQNRELTLDGVSMVDTGSQNFMVRGCVTVKGGALLKNTRVAQLVYSGSKYIIDGGTFEFDTLQCNSDADTNPPSVERKVQLKMVDGFISGTTITNKASIAQLVIDIGGGSLNMGSAANIDPRATLNLTGGTVTLGSITDDARILGAKGIVLKYDFGTSIFTRSDSATLAVDSIRLGSLQVGSAASTGFHGKFREIVFSDNKVPFRIEATSQRNFYLEGPTTIKAEADLKDTAGTTWYTHLAGDFIVDTLDATDGVTPRHLSLWSTASYLGTASLTVRGGGSLCFLQRDSASTFRFINVEAGTTLSLTNRTKGTEWGPVTAERFILGANAKVTMPAKFNHIVADSFEIDPTATIEVTIGDTPTYGAFAILQSPNGTTPTLPLSQIELMGNTTGWALKAENGQITLYKAGSASSYATEWTGGDGSGRSITTLANFQSAIPGSSSKVYFGFYDTYTTAECLKNSISGDRHAGICFLDTAIKTFTYISNGEQASNNKSDPFFCSYSGVPQKHGSGKFRTYRMQAQTMGHGPLVFEGSSTDWGWGSGDYADNYWQWFNDGDCRIARSAFNMRDLSFEALNNDDRNLNYYGNYSRITVLGNSVVDVQELCSNLSLRSSGFRVEEGGVLKFSDTLSSTRGWRRYAWTASPAGIIVNGTMDIQIPFVGGVEQVYGGRGTLKLASTVPSNAVSRVWMMDTLTTELSNDWQTVTSSSDTPLALGAAAGNPVLRVPADWTYGHSAATASAADDRAIKIREGASLTIAANGAATVNEAVIGDGTLVVANGATLTLSAPTNTAGLVVRNGSRLNAPASIAIGSLTVETGGSVCIGTDVVLMVEGDVSLSDDAFAFAGETPTGWQTVLVCTGGTVSGVPSDSGVQKTRLVMDENGRQAVQCKAVSGMMLIVL